jgi:hypothetical protein
MHDPDARRLQALISAFGEPAVAHPSVGGEDGDGADTQRMTTPQIDALLQRVAALTAVLGGRTGGDWDEIDQLAARILMSDLALITSMTRSLNDLSASRLARALADLAAAGQDADRALDDDASVERPAS